MFFGPDVLTELPFIFLPYIRTEPRAPFLWLAVFSLATRQENMRMHRGLCGPAFCPLGPELAAHLPLSAPRTASLGAGRWRGVRELGLVCVWHSWAIGILRWRRQGVDAMKIRAPEDVCAFEAGGCDGERDQSRDRRG